MDLSFNNLLDDDNSQDQLDSSEDLKNKTNIKDQKDTETSQKDKKLDDEEFKTTLRKLEFNIMKK